MTACNMKSQSSASKEESVEVVQSSSVEVYTSERKESIDTEENIVKNKKKPVMQKMTEKMEKLFYNDNVIDCKCKVKTYDMDIEFKCTYNVYKKDDDRYIWDIEDIECLSISDKSGVDIKGYINNVFSHTSLRANIISGNITYILYEDTMAIGNNIENSVNELLFKILNKFTRRNSAEYIVYDSVEGICYRGAYSFVSAFLETIVGNLPFDIDVINSGCNFDDTKKQTDKKQYLTNGNNYCVEKISDSEYKIYIDKRENKYNLEIKVR